MRASVLGIVACVLARPAAGQGTGVPSDSSLHLAAFHDSASFDVPRSWRSTGIVKSDTAVAYQYQIPHPKGDSIGTDRTVVIVMIHRHVLSGTFKTFSDSMRAYALRGQRAAILDDSLISPHQRAIFWRAQLGATPYAAYDDFMQVGSISVAVRIVVPILGIPFDDWDDRLWRDTYNLLQSIRLDGTQAWPDDIGYPVPSISDKP